MNEQRYKVEHLREYRGILTSGIGNSRFKMKLKVEDNPVLERSVEKIESSIELEFYYDWDPSASFFHAIFSCPKHSKNEQCDECDNVKDKYYQTENNLKRLQVGDTFRIMAALFKDRRSTLPPEVIDFKNYQPLLVACDEYSLRLPDTPAGINKKYELEQQRLQEEREEEEKRKEDEEQAQKDARWRKIKEKIHEFFGKSPYITQIITSVIGGLISGLISGVFIATIVEPIPRLFRWIISLF